MGTYTANYNLFLPSIGEQGWGTLVNGNFTTIDTTVKNLSNHIETLETETDARLAVLEAGEFDTVTANNFVGGVGNFDSITCNDGLTFNKTTTVRFNSNATMEWATYAILLPLIEGNIYTGSIQVFSNTGATTIYSSDKDGNVTSQRIEGNTTLTYEIPANTIMVSFYGPRGWYRPILLS